MAEGHVAHRAAAAAWLCPSAPRLAALAEGSSAHLADDPASVLLMLRFTRPTPTLENVSLNDAAFQQSSIAEAALTYLESDHGAYSAATQINEVARLIAEKAESLAAVAKTVRPSAARIAGLLAPLGWLACSSTDADLVQSLLNDDDFACNPAGLEQQRLGLTTDAIARRLAHRWKLPAWLADTLSTLRLPLNDAVRLGADRELSKVLRFAIEAVESRTLNLGLLGSREVQHREVLAVEPFTFNGLDESLDPRAVPLLSSFLRLSASSRRSSGSGRVAQLESRIDDLQAALLQSRSDFDDALRDAKLEAVAELAAGAGHEINNPLAVISGNAQLLRSREENPDRRRSLDVIVRQTGRVADLLQDLMQFARPPQAQPGVVAVSDLLSAVERDANPIANLKAVSLRVATSGEWIHGDPRQLAKALGNLVRNAIEVTPTGGIVRVYARTRPRGFEIVVEDSGPGPDAESVPHLFDPFYSGRSAGRGRGLGLSTAWQYAKQNGGDLRFERSESGPTRFAMTLALAERATNFERQSA